MIQCIWRMVELPVPGDEPSGEGNLPSFYAFRERLGGDSGGVWPTGVRRKHECWCCRCDEPLIPRSGGGLDARSQRSRSCTSNVCSSKRFTLDLTSVS